MYSIQRCSSVNTLSTSSERHKDKTLLENLVYSEGKFFLIISICRLVFLLVKSQFSLVMTNKHRQMSLLLDHASLGYKESLQTWAGFASV